MASWSATRVDDSLPWMAGRPRTPDDRRSGLDLLGEEVLAFCEWTKPNETERQLRAQVFRCFEKVVAEIWPNAKCELFGSMQTGIYLPDGDFDVVIQDPSLRYHPTYAVLSALKNAVVKGHFAAYHEVRLITGAKVPIVKLKTSERFGRFDMDVSFNSDKGPQGARESLRLLREVEARRPGNAKRVKRLALLLKTLLVTYDLNEVRDGGIGGLTVFCMALSHVQLDDAPPHPDKSHEAALDLLRFLHRYAYGFDYTQETITIAGGGGLLHKATRFPDSRPERLSIVHPVEPNRDLASGSYGYEQVVACLRYAYDKLNEFSSFFTDQARLALCGPTLCAFGVAGFRMSWPSRLQRALNEYLIQQGAFEGLAEYFQPSLPKPIPTSYKVSRSELAFGGRHISASSRVLPGVLEQPTRIYESHIYAQTECTTSNAYSASTPVSTNGSLQPPASYTKQRTAYQYSRHEVPAQVAPPATRTPILATSTSDIDQVFARLSIAPFSPPPPPSQSPQPFTPPSRNGSSPNLSQSAQPVSLRTSPPASNGSTPLSTPSDSSCGDEVVYKVTTALCSLDATPTARGFGQTFTPAAEPKSQGAPMSPQLRQPSMPASISPPTQAVSSAASWDPRPDKRPAPSTSITSADWSYTPSTPPTAASRLSPATSPLIPTLYTPATWSARSPEPSRVHWA
ncbi:hypothetical protein JCM3774_002516 [Rhodotorula dairenensis]